jgi:hypothetical protein
VSDSPAPLDERVLREIAQALREVAFGEVRLIVHNSSVVSVETTKKTRLAPPTEK